jgi:hypothetical protein
MNLLIDSAPIGISLLDVKEGNILKSLGVPADKADDHLTGMIRELTSHCKEICTPQTACSVFNDPQFIRTSGNMILFGEVFSLHKMVSAALMESTAIAVFICTCGREVEAYSKLLLQQGNPLEGFIVDLIGSEIAEELVDYTHNRITHEMAPSGIRTTNRYSPGYCNWPVSDQKQLFRIMGNNICGVKLSESSLMQPIKSVSGIIGLGPGVKNREYACTFCEADQCLYREKKQSILS